MKLIVLEKGRCIFAEKPNLFQGFPLIYVSSYEELRERMNTSQATVVLSDVKNDLKTISKYQGDKGYLIIFDTKWDKYNVLRGLHLKAKGFLETNDCVAFSVAFEAILNDQIVFCDKAAKSIRYLVNASL